MALLSVVMLALLVVGCGSATPTPTPQPTATATPTPAPTTALTPAPVLVFPALSEQALAPGRYSSSPPFGLAFTFEVVGDDWESAHLHDEFFDIMQLEEGSQSPRRWIAWGLPTAVYGDMDRVAAALRPAEAAELLSANPFVVASDIEYFSVDELDGSRLDLSTDRAVPVPIFGGPAGDFGLDQEHELRLGIVSVADELVLVLLLAPNGELEAAWTEAAPILASIDF